MTACLAPQHQESAPAAADPKFLEQYAATYRFRLGEPAGFRIVPDGSAVLFLRSGPRSFVRDLFEIDTLSGQERRLVTADALLKNQEELLSAEEKARRERMRMAARGIAEFDLSPGGESILIPLSGKLFLFERETGRVRELKGESGHPIDARFSPDGEKIALVRDGDLRVLDLASGRERRLTWRSGPHIQNGEADFIAQEEMERMQGYWWSPDSARIAYQQTDTSAMEIFHIADAFDPANATQSWPYPRAGMANAAVRLGITGVDGGSTTWVEWDRERYPYLATVRWQENAPLTLVVQNRRQTEEAVMAVDIETGATDVLLIERDEAWINLDTALPEWLPDGSGFLWLSERSGHSRLELRDRSGGLIRELTPPEIEVSGVADLGDDDTAIVSASAEPTERHLYAVALSGETPPRRLSSGRGLHAAHFSPRHHDSYVAPSRLLDGTKELVVRKRNGDGLTSIASRAEEPPFLPNLELLSVGTQGYRCAVIRPHHFDAERRYPTLVSVYGGPGYSVVNAEPSHYLLEQWFADHGFIVVSIDGRGTPGRGRDWERAIKGNLIAVPLEDQVEAFQALAEVVPQIDRERVGIFGWSFGGYFSAMAVMRRPEIFHAGVAGAPVSDWRDYDTHYTERYLGLPDENATGYADSSLLTHAEKLARPLLIIHGTGDDNVYFLHSIKLSNALFHAGKRHEFLPIAGHSHMLSDASATTQLYTRIIRFFEQNL
jgi:dipeptidyl-peptidase-4